ncbi:MAG: hypothetical protein ABII82_01925 [Verrucomicrobiota bacterium]
MDLREAVKLLGLPVAGREDLQLVTELRERIMEASDKTMGAERKHVLDVRELSPEVFRIDHFRFWSLISTTGGITTSAEAISVPPKHDFVLKRIAAYVQEAAADQTPDNWARVFFNCTEEGRGFNVFSSKICFAELLGALSPSHPFVWENGFYRFRAGSKIVPEITVDVSATGPGAWTASTNSKVYGISFIGDLVIAKQ